MKSHRKPESAREIALGILIDVEERDAYANLLLSHRLNATHLSKPDAGFVTELVSGTLRMRTLYDEIIAQVTNRSVTEIDVVPRNILRMACHQLLTLRTGAHAAVNESVNLQKLRGRPNAVGFVNGVLRKVSQHDTKEWISLLTKDATPDHALAVRYAHPEWIVRALRDALRSEGSEGELEELLEADNTAPKVNLALLPSRFVNTSKLDAAVAGADLARVGPSPLGFQLAHGAPGKFTHDSSLAPIGTLRVQDQGSQLAALTLLEATPIHSDEQWLDLCAGPGGKTAILAAYAKEHDAQLRAVELSEHRSQLVREAVQANAEPVEIVIEDGTSEQAFGNTMFNRILVDAPCSGLGSLRRRPESRNRKVLSDLPQLTHLQHQLLSSAAAHLKPCGVVAYVTCSPHLAETRVIVDRVLRDRSDLIELDTKSVLSGISQEELHLAGSALSAQLWPHRHGTDAMFIALLQRRLDV